MQFVLTRLEHDHEGHSIALKDGNVSRTLAVVNGNTSTHRGPVILLSLDQHSVYGLSHPVVISRIIADGPQTLLTSREVAHRLYEGGMRAALASIRIKQNVFQTSLETFYRIEDHTKYFAVVPGKSPEQVGCLVIMGGKNILLAHRGFKPQNVPVPYEFLALDQINTTLEIDVGSPKE